MKKVGRVLGVVAVGVLSVGQAMAEASDRPGGEAPRAYPVLVGDEPVLRLRAMDHNVDAAARAASATRALAQALEGSASEIRTQSAVDVSSIYVGDQRIISLTAEDATLEGRASAAVFAEEVATRLRESMRRERHRKEIAERVLGISGIVFFGLVALLLFRFIGRMSKRGARWAAREAHGSFAVRVQTLEILPAAAAREALRLAIVGGSWLLRAGLVYTWLLAVLSLFTATRPLVGKATGYLFSPAIDLMARLASRLPLVFALFLALLAVLLVVRFITVYTGAIERREIETEWLRPETARTTGTLLIIATSLSALLFVTPLLAGTSDGSLTRIGVLGLGALALAATPYLASCVLGVRAVYGGGFTLGDRIDYGGQRGKVLAISLFDVALLGDEGAELRVPHLMSLWNVTRLLPAAAPEPQAPE